MNFANLSALGWLLPLGGVIVALYLLRMRRKDVRVPATFLWPERTEEVRANALFQKLRFNWLLVLQLLALLLAVFALARPQTRQAGLIGEVTVVVIDSSASMGATDVAPSRLGEAKRIATDAIRSAKAGDRIAVIDAGAVPRVVIPLSNDPARAISAVDALGETDSEGDMGEALRLATALVSGEGSARVLVLSDGVFEKVQDFSPGKASLIYRQIGSSGENLAIAALGTADTTSGKQLYCGIKNSGAQPQNAVLNLYADGKLFNSLRLTAKPGKIWGQTVTYPAGAHALEARLEAKDTLQADNYAAVLTNPASSLNVLLVTKGNLFLERALALDPRVTLDKATNLPSGANYDVVVFDGTSEQPTSARGVLTLGSAGSTSPVATRGAIRNPGFVSSSSELMRGVDLRNVFIDRGEKVQPKANGRVVASSKEGPLVVVSEGSRKQIYVAFEPLQSDFPLSVGFPIFVANALTFLGGENSGEMLVSAGAPFTVTTNGGQIRGEGFSATLNAKNGVATVRGLPKAGRYTLDLGKEKRAVFAQLRSETESNILPREKLELGAGQVAGTRAPSRSADFWRPLLLLCLIVLGGEWWLYARRS